MTEQHPITPPPELVTSLRNSAPHGIGDTGVTRETWLIHNAYALGADQELEACCEWLETYVQRWAEWSANFRADRRPKPPSLKEQALKALDDISIASFEQDAANTIRYALEQLDD